MAVEKKIRIFVTFYLKMQKLIKAIIYQPWLCFDKTMYSVPANKVIADPREPLLSKPMIKKSCLISGGVAVGECALSQSRADPVALFAFRLPVTRRKVVLVVGDAHERGC